MKKTIKNYGFVPPTYELEHHLFGDGMVPLDVPLVPDLNWQPYCPQGENQFTVSFDTYGCTVFNTLDMLEVLRRRVTGLDTNYSDRLTYVESETRPPGNDPHVVAEAIRQSGVLNEARLPFTPDIDTLDKFVDLGPSPAQLVADAAKWLDYYNFKHDWLWKDDRTPLIEKQNAICNALAFSPIGVSVRAWQQRENGLYYKDIGAADTHWTGLVYAKKGMYWIIYDSYPDETGSYFKKLEWDYDFGCAKRYYLGVKKTEPTEIPKGDIPVESLSTLRRIINWIISLFKKS